VASVEEGDADYLEAKTVVERTTHTDTPIVSRAFPF
jgi:hypothetical protein